MKTIPTASAAVDGPGVPVGVGDGRFDPAGGGLGAAPVASLPRVGVVVAAMLFGSTVGGGVAVAASTPLKVVAAENFWGSIVKQLAGSKASVSSVITNPDTDPHNYEAKPSDARAIASRGT